MNVRKSTIATASFSTDSPKTSEYSSGSQLSSAEPMMLRRGAGAEGGAVARSATRGLGNKGRGRGRRERERESRFGARLSVATGSTAEMSAPKSSASIGFWRSMRIQPARPISNVR